MTQIFLRGAEAKHLHDDRAPTGELGRPSATRASHVEPYRTVDSFGRQVIRWYIDLRPSNGPVMGRFKTRDEALAAEKDWLNLKLETPEK